MTETERDLVLALLGRLRERESITEKQYLDACRSRLLAGKGAETSGERTAESGDGTEPAA